MLEVKDLSIHYGQKQVVQHFSCQVRHGEMVCICGQSGCGKTSILKSLIGFAPFTGFIRIRGEKLSQHNCESIRNHTAYLPQELSFPTEYVHQAVEMVTNIRGNLPEQTRKELLEMNLEQLGLETELLNRRIAEVSGGQRQRIILAAIAVLNRDIWLLDEPTSALDHTSRNLVVKFLHQRQKQGTTLIIVSHDTDFAAQCSRIIEMS